MLALLIPNTTAIHPITYTYSLLYTENFLFNTYNVLFAQVLEILYFINLMSMKYDINLYVSSALL